MKTQGTTARGGGGGPLGLLLATMLILSFATHLLDPFSKPLEKPRLRSPLLQEPKQPPTLTRTTTKPSKDNDGNRKTTQPPHFAQHHRQQHHHYQSQQPPQPQHHRQQHYHGQSRLSQPEPQTRLPATLYNPRILLLQQQQQQQQQQHDDRVRRLPPPRLLAPPKEWIMALEDRLEDNNPMDFDIIYRDEAVNSYLAMLQKYVLATVFDDDDDDDDTQQQQQQNEQGGVEDRSSRLALTTTTAATTAPSPATAALRNVRQLLEQVLLNRVQGDYLEFGRGGGGGGVSLYARGVWSAWETMTHRIPLEEQQQHRKVYLCDSFAGDTATSGDGDWNDQEEEEEEKDQEGNNHATVLSLRIAQHFYQAGLLPPPPLEKNNEDNKDEDGGGGVVFCQGPIPQTTELVAQKVQSLAVLRLGSEQTYESTKRILLRLYDKVSPGGYVVVDGSWQDAKPNDNHQRLSPAARACQDFFQSLTHKPTLSGDDKVVFWQKDVEWSNGSRVGESMKD